MGEPRILLEPEVVAWARVRQRDRLWSELFPSPHDVGELSGARVVDVISRADDKAVVHVVEGDSVAPDTVAAVAERIRPGARTLVLLDSDHRHEHVRAELEAYAGFVTPGSYLVVFDTFIEILDGPVPGRPFGPGNSPQTAVDDFLLSHEEFEVDAGLQGKIMISEAMGGYLRRRGRQASREVA